VSEHLQQQLDLLRRKIAKIDRKYASTSPSAPAEGPFQLLTRLWPPHFHHGSADVGALSELPATLLSILEPGVESPPQRWIFLDTETTGLVGGSGTLAFLTGVGWISPQGFELQQFFLRDHGEEAAALQSLASLLEAFDVLVTYNGKSFDIPLLETRYRLNRLPSPFSRLRHIDLLHSARRLWRLALESCRLKELEARILGVERHGDVEGALIPDLYFQFLRTKNLDPLQPVFYHNAIDVLSLACLTAVVPVAIGDPDRINNAAEMVGLARWLRSQGRLDDALTLFRRAVKRNLNDELLYHTLWLISSLEKKLGNYDAALAVWSELTTVPNPFQAQAYEQLAIHYEHREKNITIAIELTRTALELNPTPELQKRQARLAKKMASGAIGLKQTALRISPEGRPD
jgi:uncharacterized protein